MDRYPRTIRQLKSLHYKYRIIMKYLQYKNLIGKKLLSTNAVPCKILLQADCSTICPEVPSLHFCNVLTLILYFLLDLFCLLIAFCSI